MCTRHLTPALAQRAPAVESVAAFLPSLDAGGSLVAWKASVSAQERRDGDAAAALLGLAPAHRQRVASFPGADHHSLYVYLKVGPTPNRYPRRPGMASKRPLRAST